jgi:hypothetical protein
LTDNELSQSAAANGANKTRVGYTHKVFKRIINILTLDYIRIIYVSISFKRVKTQQMSDIADVMTILLSVKYACQSARRWRFEKNIPKPEADYN